MEPTCVAIQTQDGLVGHGDGAAAQIDEFNFDLSDVLGNDPLTHLDSTGFGAGVSLFSKDGDVFTSLKWHLIASLSWDRLALLSPFISTLTTVFESALSASDGLAGSASFIVTNSLRNIAAATGGLAHSSRDLSTTAAVADASGFGSANVFVLTYLAVLIAADRYAFIPANLIWDVSANLILNHATNGNRDLSTFVFKLGSTISPIVSPTFGPSSGLDRASAGRGHFAIIKDGLSLQVFELSLKCALLCK
jgi:hypothetical protein